MLSKYGVSYTDIFSQKDGTLKPTLFKYYRLYEIWTREMYLPKKPDN